MKPEQFIREFGVEKAREVVDGAPDWAVFWITRNEYHISMLSFPNMTDQHSFIVADLKRLVEYLDLIEKEGGYEFTKQLLAWGGSKISDEYGNRLCLAIKDHESIYGGGDDL